MVERRNFYTEMSDEEFIKYMEGRFGGVLTRSDILTAIRINYGGILEAKHILDGKPPIDREELYPKDEPKNKSSEKQKLEQVIKNYIAGEQNE